MSRVHHVETRDSMLQMILPEGSSSLLAFFGILFAFGATVLAMAKLSPYLPKDAGREFAHDGKLSAGKPRGAGIIFVLAFVASVLLFSPLSAELVIYLLLILAFNYFYVAIQYNPVEIANNLRRNNGSIPGFRPGKPTSDFITRTLNKITLIGAIFLAVVAVLPIVLGNLTGMSIQLGGTSLLIVVGVALDTTRSLDSFMTMRSHKGFLG